MLDHAAPVDPKMAHHEPGIQIKPITVGMWPSNIMERCTERSPQTVITELEEEGVRVALTVVDTPGFGDNIDNERWYAQVSRNRPTSFQLRCLRSASARY